MRHLAALITARNPAGVARLLELDPSLVDKHVQGSRTPLMLAATLRGNIPVVHVLLEAKANPSLVTKNGETALWLACKEGQLGNVNELLAWRTTELEQPNQGDLHTPLMIASLRNHPQVVEALLEAGANPEKVDAQQRTPLLLASEFGSTNVVSLLLLKAPQTLNLRDLYGNTALMRAIKHPDVVHQLLTAGARTDLSTARGVTVHSLATTAAANPLVLPLLKASSPEEREGLLNRRLRVLFDRARTDPASFLGKGAYGSVRTVERNGHRYALKRMIFDRNVEKGNGINVSERSDFNVEVKGLHHVGTSPYALHLVDFDVSDENAYLLTEKLEGMDLLKAIRKGRLDDSNIRAVAIQLLKGLESIHDQGLLHLDIKPPNLWVTPSVAGRPLQLKYIDFGMSCTIPCVKKSNDGTPAYMRRPDRYEMDALNVDDHPFGYTFDRTDDFYALSVTFQNFREWIVLSKSNDIWLQGLAADLYTLPDTPTALHACIVKWER